MFLKMLIILNTACLYEDVTFAFNVYPSKLANLANSQYMKI